MVRSIILAAAAAFTLGACATQAASTETPRGDCFRAESINGFSPVDDHNVKISVGANREYILTSLSRLTGLNFEQELAVESHSGWICTGNGLDLRLHTRGPFHQTFAITNVARAPEPEPAAPQGS